jgi:serine/threonine protein kinase
MTRRIKHIRKTNKIVQLQGGMWNCNTGEQLTTKKRSLSIKNKNKQVGGVRVKKNGTKKQRKHPKKYKGGFFAGEGAFGVLFNGPRLPCAAGNDGPEESIDDVQGDEEMTQVGKIYENDVQNFRLLDTSSKAEQEMDVVKRLTDGGFNIAEMSRYFILPIKMCQINRDALGRIPYNAPYNNPAWRFSKDGRRQSIQILNSTNQLPRNWNTMVISKLGTSDIASIITNSDSNPIDDINLFDNLTKLRNVVIGVQKIQERGFIHGDLKAVNIIAIDGTFKIGDNSDLRSIADEKADMLNMPEAFEYYVWPSIVIYSVFFIPKKPYNAASPYKNASDTTKVVMKNPRDILEKLYMNQNSFNDDSIRVRMYQHLVEPFNIISDIGFTPEQVEKITTYSKTLLGQKLFNYDLLIESDFTTYNSASKFKSALSNNDEGIRNYLRSFNLIMQSFTDMASQKMDLLKRVDIYSLGLVILKCVGEYIKYKTKYVEKVLNPDVIIQLYDLVYLCCNQEGLCPDINAIVEEYDRILTELRPMSTPVPTPVPTPEPTPQPTPVSTPEPSPVLSQDNMQTEDDQPPSPFSY